MREITDICNLVQQGRGARRGRSVTIANLTYMVVSELQIAIDADDVLLERVSKNVAKSLKSMSQRMGMLSYANYNIIYQVVCCCLLLFVCCLLLFVIHCLLFIVCRLLFVVVLYIRNLLFIVYCLLFVVAL